jgi:hypothetical protein
MFFAQRWVNIEMYCIVHCYLPLQFFHQEICHFGVEMKSRITSVYAMISFWIDGVFKLFVSFY